MKKILFALLLFLAPAIVRGQQVSNGNNKTNLYNDSGESQMSLGVEFNSTPSNLGGNFQIPVLVPFIMHGISGNVAANPVGATIASTSQGECLVLAAISRQSPGRFSGTGTDAPTNIPAYPVFGIGNAHDPNAITPHGGGGAPYFYADIIKTYLISGATSGGMQVNTGYNQFINGLQVNAGDWLVIHNDCAQNAGVNIDVEIQMTIDATLQTQPQYVQLFSDTLARTNENPLSNGGWWIKNSSVSVSAAQLISNLIEPAAINTTTVQYFNVAGGSNFSPPLDSAGNSNQYSEIAIAKNLGGTAQGPVVRFSNSVLSGYVLLSQSNTWTIFKDVTGTLTSLISGSLTGPGTVLRLEVKGSVLFAKQCLSLNNPTSCIGLGTISDSSFTSGQVGFYMNSDSTLSDNSISGWGAGVVNF